VRALGLVKLERRGERVEDGVGGAAGVAGSRRARGRVEPGKVFDQAVGLDDIASGYGAMADRTALKVLVQPWPSGNTER
jgi:hypothetical protein